MWSTALALVILQQTGCAGLDSLTGAPFQFLGNQQGSRSKAQFKGDLTPESEADVQIAIARSAELDGKIDYAMEGYRKAINMENRLALPFYRLALLHDKQGDCRSANALYHEALKRAPDVADIHCDLGYNCYLQGRWQEAEQNLRKALELRPDFPRAHNNLGMLLSRSGRIEEAIHEYARAGVSQRDAHVNLAVAFASDGDVAGASQQLEFASFLRPDGKNDQVAELQGLVRQVGAAAAVTTQSEQAVPHLEPVPVRPY